MMLYFRVLHPAHALDIEYSRDNGAPQKIHLEAKVREKAVVTDLTDSFNFWDMLRDIESDNEVTYHYKMEGDIGYLQIPRFVYYDDGFISGLLKKVSNSKAIVIDLRGNPGGAVKALEDIAGYFEPQPVVVADLLGRKKPEQIKVKPKNPNLPVPMVILVDSQSFSCSELFARHSSARDGPLLWAITPPVTQPPPTSSRTKWEPIPSFRMASRWRQRA
jgi:C-terminal processing protease CtpA/Prc